MDGNIENKGRFSSIIPYLTPLHKKTIVSALGVLVLTLGTATGIVLVQNQQSFRSLATCYDCSGGTCPDGWSYGPDSCSLQPCGARHTEACANHQGGGGGGGGGGGDPQYCAICAPNGDCECINGQYNGMKCKTAPDSCSNLGNTWQPDGSCPSGGACGGQGPPPPPSNPNVCETGGVTSPGCYGVAVNGNCAIAGGGWCDKTGVNDDGDATCACRPNATPTSSPTCDNMCNSWKVGPCGGELDYVRCQSTHKLWTRSCPGDSNNACSEAKCLEDSTCGGGAASTCTINSLTAGVSGSCGSGQSIRSSVEVKYSGDCSDHTISLHQVQGNNTHGLSSGSLTNTNGPTTTTTRSGGRSAPPCGDTTVYTIGRVDGPSGVITQTASSTISCNSQCNSQPPAPPPSGNACEDAGHECRYCPPFVGSWVIGDEYQNACTGFFDACCDTGSGEAGQGQTTINDVPITVVATKLISNMNQPVTADNKDVDLNNDNKIDGVDWAQLADKARQL